MAREMNVQVGTIKDLKKGTNIKDVKVPPQLRQRIKTGIPFFDFSCGMGEDESDQGLVPGTVMMLTGGPGAGKSTLFRQLADSITSSGHVALYNTGEESLYQVAMAVERLELTHGFVPGQDELVNPLLTHADWLMEKHPKKQVFLLQDSLQALDDGFYKDGTTNSRTPVRCTEILTDWAKRTYGIVVFIGQATKGGDFAGKNAIRHTVDVHGQLYIDKDKKSDTWGERLFEVTKNRWGIAGQTIIVGMARKGLYEKGRYSITSDSEDS